MTNLKLKVPNVNAFVAEKSGTDWQVDHVKPDMEKVTIQSISYDASEGKEIFISAEDQQNNILLRLFALACSLSKGSQARNHRHTICYCS